MAQDPVSNPDRATLVLVLRSHPDWTLAQLVELAGTKSGKLLERVRVCDLWNGVDPQRLALAQRLRGAQFDVCVLAAIVEAATHVGASYLRARVGGPRWKLQASLGRLVKAGKVERSGATSRTRYWSVQGQDN